KVSRWRPLWLWVPAACGIVWVIGAGPPAAAAGFGHGPAATASALPRGFTGPARLAPAAGPGGRRLARPVPLGRIAGAAGAARAGGLGGLHREEGDVPAARPGLVPPGGRGWTVAPLGGGRVLTRDGARLGVDEATGGPAVLSWHDAGGGVLLTGA